MLQFPKNLSETRILVTNDDGIHAPGIGILTKIAKSLSNDVWVVAPELEQSGAGHSLTLHMPLRVRKLGARKFAVSGTPTDCVLLGVKEIVKKKPVGLVLSGINRSSNVAEDVTYSGTIAAAMEGTLLDIPSIAVSQAISDMEPVFWETAEYHLPRILKALQGYQFPDANLLSVNLPHLPPKKVRGIEIAPQGRRKIADKLDGRVDPKGRPYYWIGGTGYDGISGDPGMDYTLLSQGHITITPLHLDLTNAKMMQDLKTLFARVK